MVRLKHKLSEPPLPPERGVKAATFRLLLDTAMALIQQGGHIPSLAEVAARSKVSRATTYRYFPSRSALVTAVVDSSLGPVRALASSEADGRARVHELFVQTFPRFKEFEPQMRAAAQLSLEQWALERAGLLEEEPYRRGHRVRILEHAIAPLAPTLPAAVRDRLHRALSVVYGIEPYMILKDIWGLPDREVERIALWMADALIDAALRDAAAPKRATAAAARSARADRTAGDRDAAPDAPWFDAQYNNRARIPEHPAILRAMGRRARHARARQLALLARSRLRRRRERAARRLPADGAGRAGAGLHPRRLLARARQARPVASSRRRSSTPARWSCCRTTRSARR